MRRWLSIVVMRFSLASFAVLVCVVTSNAQESKRDVCLRWPVEQHVEEATEAIFQAYKSESGNANVIDARRDFKATPGRFADPDAPFDLISQRGAIGDAERERILSIMTDVGPPEIIVVGVRRCVIVVNSASPLKKLSLPQIARFMQEEGAALLWSDIGGRSGRIQCYVEGLSSWSLDLLRLKCMGYTRVFPRYKIHGYHKWRADIMSAREGGADVIAKVKADVNGIGFLQYTGQSLEGVKVLAIAADEDSEAVMPKLEPVMQPDYPLAEPLVLYLHPKAPPVAKQFCDFAISHEGSAVLEKLGFVTPTTEFRFHAEKRLTDLKSGKGEKVAACGAVGGSNALAGRAAREMMGSLAEEFVRAKAVVQLGYSPMATDVAGIGAFLATTGAGEAMRPRQELLLLDDRPSERAMQAHGERWAALGRDAAGQPDGTGPEEYLIAARGVAVIVNPSNKLNSLTLDQLRSVFSGEVQDWSILAGGVAGAGGGGAGKQEIKLFGLPQADVVTQIFTAECLATDKWRRVTIRKSSDEVIKAVASDPAAIGIVDLATVGPVALAGLQSETAASAAGRSVKLLSIDLGRAAGGGAGGAGGLRGAAAMPPIPATADNLKNAMYPLSQRLYLYVHPLASDTAKDFAKFVATCGASEATPYADTVKSMIETYQKNGLIPLADEAINRMAKDALAAATKED